MGQDKVISKTVPPRGTWSNNLEVFLVLLSSSLDIDNILAFPLQVTKYGVIFFFQYAIMLALVTMPIIYFEYALGQFCGGNLFTIYHICPAVLGILLVQLILNIYYLVLYSFQLSGNFYHMFSIIQGSVLNSTGDPHFFNDCFPSDSLTKLYFQASLNKINICHDPWESDGFRLWKLHVFLFVAWFILFLSVYRGTFSFSKMCAVTLIFPIIFFLFLLINSILFPEAISDVKELLLPEWKSILDVEGWVIAIKYALFTFNIGSGQIITLGSYNNFRQDFSRTIFYFYGTIILIPFLISILLILLVGTRELILWYETYNPMEIRQGYTMNILTFSKEAQESLYRTNQIWSITAYGMIISLLISSAALIFETVLSIVKDIDPSQRRSGFWISAFGSFIFLIVSLIALTDRKQFMEYVQYEWWMSSFKCYCLILMMIAVLWIYGDTRFFNDIEFMTKKPVNLFWKLCLKYLTPTLLFVLLYYTAYYSYYNPKDFTGNESIDKAWMTIIIFYVIIPAGYLFEVLRSPVKGLYRKFMYPLYPTRDWEPRPPYVYPAVLNKSSWTELLEKFTPKSKKEILAEVDL